MMELETLQKIHKKVQRAFENEEDVKIEIPDHQFIEGDQDMFILKTNCYYNREDRALVDGYIKRVETILNEMGYDVKLKMYSSLGSGPIEGTIVAFHPIERELDIE